MSSPGPWHGEASPHPPPPRSSAWPGAPWASEPGGQGRVQGPGEGWGGGELTPFHPPPPPNPTRVLFANTSPRGPPRPSPRVFPGWGELLPLAAPHSPPGTAAPAELGAGTQSTQEGEKKSIFIFCSVQGPPCALQPPYRSSNASRAGGTVK